MNRFGVFILGIAIGISIGYFGSSGLSSDPERAFTECLADASTRPTDSGVHAAAEACRRQRKAALTAPHN